MNTGLFFAKQMTQNACATQAILSVLFNSPGINLGPALQEFKEFTSEFDPETKGEVILSNRYDSATPERNVVKKHAKTQLHTHVNRIYNRN